MGESRLIYKHKTNIKGLKYCPTFGQVYKDNLDSFSIYNDYIQSIDASQENMYHGPIDFTDYNAKIIHDVLLSYKYTITLQHKVRVLEIGAARGKPSSTDIFLTSSDIYYGVDLRDLTELVKSTPTCKAQTLIANSFEQDKVRAFVGSDPIDILFIDGDHSIKTVLNDWQYQDLVRRGGYIIFHDISHHPGPREVFDAIDEQHYVKRRFCLNDYGIGIVQKKKDNNDF